MCTRPLNKSINTLASFYKPDSYHTCQSHQHLYNSTEVIVWFTLACTPALGSRSLLHGGYICRRTITKECFHLPQWGFFVLLDSTLLQIPLTGSTRTLTRVFAIDIFLSNHSDLQLSAWILVGNGSVLLTLLVLFQEQCRRCIPTRPLTPQVLQGNFFILLGWLHAISTHRSLQTLMEELLQQPHVDLHQQIVINITLLRLSCN